MFSIEQRGGARTFNVCVGEGQMRKVEWKVMTNKWIKNVFILVTNIIFVTFPMTTKLCIYDFLHLVKNDANLDSKMGEGCFSFVPSPVSPPFH